MLINIYSISLNIPKRSKISEEEQTYIFKNVGFFIRFTYQLLAKYYKFIRIFLR